MSIRRDADPTTKRQNLRDQTRYELFVSEQLAERIVEEWAAEAARRGLRPGDAPYWSEASGWIALRFFPPRRLD
jgi:hypothetical protein